MTTEQAALNVCRAQIRAGNADAVKLERWMLDGFANHRPTMPEPPPVSPRHSIAATYPPPPAPFPLWQALLLAVLIVGGLALLLFAAGVTR